MYYSRLGKPVPQNYEAGKVNANKMQSDYNQLIKSKEMEINRQMKSLIKDSLRISYKELGSIHYNHGFIQEANKEWIKSFDMSIQDEDIFHMACLIAKSAF